MLPAPLCPSTLTGNLLLVLHHRQFASAHSSRLWGAALTPICFSNRLLQPSQPVVAQSLPPTLTFLFTAALLPIHG